MVAHLRCFLSQTILNRLLGRVKLRHIPKTFALSVEWQRTYGAFSRKFFRKSGAQVLNGIDIPFSASSSVFKELTLKSLSKYLNFNNNKSKLQVSL